ncbi:ATP-binding protein [Peribacillus alkalitolerans]|uniref:ATP-binding protein n=1 Tax=Peribacillus alkalitolerans TaxID=1550385 RepID=UPI0013D6F2D6|nr:sensor histidine kinase [Peribacillus alkalitolerans]
MQQRDQYERQKLETVGTLAASATHEIKNPLTGVKGLIQLLSEKYKDQVKQVVLNIVKNAFQASSAGDKGEIQMFPKDEFIVIQISDQGIGMDEFTLKRIFEPFFTSKKDGTGLGLFICQKMIEQFNGKIEVYNEKDAGTTLQIYLPFIV